MFSFWSDQCAVRQIENVLRPYCFWSDGTSCLTRAHTVWRQLPVWWDLRAHDTVVITTSIWHCGKRSVIASCSFAICLQMLRKQTEGIGAFTSHCNKQRKLECREVIRFLKRQPNSVLQQFSPLFDTKKSSSWTCENFCPLTLERVRSIMESIMATSLFDISSMWSL